VKPQWHAQEQAWKIRPVRRKELFKGGRGRIRIMRTAFAMFCLAGLSLEAAGTAQEAKSHLSETGEPRGEELFRDREWQVDLFGLGAFYNSAEGNFAGSLAGTGGNARQFSGRPGWGFGLGASYFFQRFIGLGVEQDIFGRTDGGFRRGDFGYIRWATIGNLFLRYPIEAWRIAPYAMVGGGAMYGNAPSVTINVGRGRQATYRLSGQGFGHVGGGLDCRITQNVGVFSDLRYVFSGVDGLPDSQMLWRFGVRFAF
jgi:hypothetical protein